jgi:hypothetical protein
MVEAVQESLPTSVDFMVRKRDGRVVDFDRTLIGRAISAAFRAELGLPEDQALPPKITADVLELTDALIAEIVDELRDPENSGCGAHSR